MKYKIIQAPNMKQAMIKIHQELGANALICRSRKSVGGIEILVGLPDSDGDAENSLSTSFEQSIQTTNPTAYDYRIDELSRKVAELTSTLSNVKQPHKKIRLFSRIKEYKYLINKMFMKHAYNNSLYRNAKNKLLTVESLLAGMGIKIRNKIYDRRVHAIVGPSGTGKTTTVIKMAVQFSTNQDVRKLGIISTNIDDLYLKNKLEHFCHLYQVDFIHITTLNELNAALEIMEHKDLVLIDTHGIAQRDVISINRQRHILESAVHDISVYVTVSASQQTEVIEDVLKFYSFKHIAGCIITKADEALRLEPVLSVIAKCELPVSYICNGEDLDNDIYTVKDQNNSADFSLERFINSNIREFSTQF